MNDGKGEAPQASSPVAVADPRFVDIKSLKDISDHTLTEIRHFFEMYQVLEQGEVEIIGW